MTLFDAADAVLVPAVFVAVTVNVYDVPLVSPVTVHGELEHVPVSPPGLDVAVYDVIVAPPSLDGAVKVTEACVFPAVATPIVGAPATTAAIENDCATCDAAKYAALPA